MNQKAKACLLVALAMSSFFWGLSSADETDMVWGTFLGGSDKDWGFDIALDESGNVYVTGATKSVDFPVTDGGFDAAYNGGWEDVFVAKLNPSGTALLYATYLGGSENERGASITTDNSGNAYVTGSTTSPDFPITAGAWDSIHNKSEVFVTKLAPDASTLAYSTFLGGNDQDQGHDIAVDAHGCAHVIGETASSDFPITAGAFDDTRNGSHDVFVAKLNAKGSSLDYATFLGGSGSENGDGIFVDQAGNVYLTGYTKSKDFPTTAGAFDTDYSGGYDAFVTKLNARGMALDYSTFLGGSAPDCGVSIVAVSSGEAYLTGWTRSPEFPTTDGAFETKQSGDYDIFVVKLNATGSALDYATFLGGSQDDRGYDISVDGSGSAYIIGRTGTSTGTSDFPTTPGAFDVTFNGSKDAVMAKFDPMGDLEYSTFLGGTDGDVGRGIALDDAGGVYLTGRTWSDDFPTTSGAFDTVYNDFEAFVARLRLVGASGLSQPSMSAGPKAYDLFRNHPNPFDTSTEIGYQIPEAKRVTLTVFDIQGHDVRTLVNAEQQAGDYTVAWDGSDAEGREMSSGLYFCRLRAGDFCKTIKMMLLR